ncbi:hypothetical protein UlMin_007626 [Ulmus minor]
MEARVKREIVEVPNGEERSRKDDVKNRASLPVIDLDSSSDDSDDDNGVSSGNAGGSRRDGSSSKKRKVDEVGAVVPFGVSDCPPVLMSSEIEATTAAPGKSNLSVPGQNFKQFWKAGDYEGSPCGDWDCSSGGMDHARVHPKFLHSNATSHKWALGAFAELLDNALDEVCNGATYVNIGMLVNKKDGSRMLLVEDNGGGMNPDKMRHCMSLGYSMKSKLANTIGQYGNGFKTSTMRLGADVIVFTRCCGKDGESPTQSIGLLSYSFLRSTGKEDIIVPMLDYKSRGGEWKEMMRSSLGDWNKNLETIVQWSPFSTEAELLHQFSTINEHGTRIIIYNLWEDDQGHLELDFDADPHDIQIRGVNRDEKNIQMAKQYPNSRHFLTYRHSLRSYASILYLRLPPGFRIILRGKDVDHHSIVNDMMKSEKVTYRPQPGVDGVPKDINMVAEVTIGFVKDARFHIDVQGFNVYHKNRLIKPFWRLWNPAGSDGRGVIGVLEANFVEPAHDKQGFERTVVLSRLEAKLIQMQKNYWRTYCTDIGYAPRMKMKPLNGSDREDSPDYLSRSSAYKGQSSASKANGTNSSSKGATADPNYTPHTHPKGRRQESEKASTIKGHGQASNGGKDRSNFTKSGKSSHFTMPSSPVAEYISDDDIPTNIPENEANGNHHKESLAEKVIREDSGPSVQPTSQSQSKDSQLHIVEQLKEENHQLKQRLKDREEKLKIEQNRCKLLEAKLQEAEEKIAEQNTEHETLCDIFQEERDRRDSEENNLRNKLQDASATIQELLNKVRALEKRR